MDVRSVVRQHILDNHFPRTEDRALRDDTPLITGGMIDSVGMIRLIHFIEERFDIEFMPREVDRDRLDTLDRIDQLIRWKLSQKASDSQK